MKAVVLKIQVFWLDTPYQLGKYRASKHHQADPGNCALEGVGLRPLDCWDPGFEFC